jgi:hypothetical protein
VNRRIGYDAADVSDSEKNKGSEPEALDDDDEPAEADRAEPDAPDDDEPNSEHMEPSHQEKPSAWGAMAQRAQDLWDAGNNAELRKLLTDLEKAPPDEKEALELAHMLRRRLKPDPVAIGLWLLTLGVFCYLTYLYVLN